MEKTYRKMRAKLRRKQDVSSSVGTWFLFRLFLCTVVFLALSGVKLRGGEELKWTKNKVEYFLGGAPAIAQAYEESVEVFNRFCDRVIEAQAQND